MWGFQGHFRSSVQHEIDDSLKLIGVDADPLVLLVGLSESEDVSHPVCVEPESGPFTSRDLGEISSRAAAFFADDPETQILHSDSDLDERRQGGLRQQALGRAIATSIKESGAYPERTVIVGAPGRQGDHDVYTVVLLDQATFEQPPAFETEISDRLYVGRSLQHEVVSECLRRAAEAVQVPEAGRSLFVLGSSQRDLVRVAGRRFLDGLTIRASGMPSDLFEHLSRIAELPYERAAASGRLLIAEAEAIELDVELLTPVRLTNARSARKLLETCVSGASLVSDGRSLVGLSRSIAKVGQDANYLDIAVSGTAEWEVRWGEERYMQVSFGQPRLPVIPISPETFADTLQRRIPRCDVGALWPLVTASQQFGHGTTIVIAESAADEARRLGTQGQPIRPRLLTPADLESVAAVDGAVVVDPDARCHAFGIILDGQSDGEGDPARGSRYNSAVRYCRSLQTPCAAIIVSDDGTVDLVPSLRRRVDPQRLEDALAKFESTIETDRLDGEPYARERREIERLAFYLNAEQCDRANFVDQQIWSGRAKRGGITLHQPRFRPHPEMDDSYFIES